MPSRFRWLMCVVLATFLLNGCYNTPVRHLASDVALLKIGESKSDNVLTYLGEPDDQIVLEDGVEKWVFIEHENSSLKKAPLVGKYFGEQNYDTVTVILKNDVVIDCIYGAWAHTDNAWADDFDWQENEQ